MRSRTAAPATYSRTDHIAMVVLATVGCLLLLGRRSAIPFQPRRAAAAGALPQSLNCRILNSTLKLSSCDDNYDANKRSIPC